MISFRKLMCTYLLGCIIAPTSTLVSASTSASASTLASALASTSIKNCTETIDLGFSSYIISHTVYKLNLPNKLLTVGQGSHDIGIMPDETVIRLYNYSFELFPLYIYRDANNPVPYDVDEYLLYEQNIKK